MSTLVEWVEKREAIHDDIANLGHVIYDVCDQCDGQHANEYNPLTNGKSLCTFIGDCRYCNECLKNLLASYRVDLCRTVGVAPPSSDMRYDGQGRVFPDRKNSYADRAPFRRTE